MNNFILHIAIFSRQQQTQIVCMSTLFHILLSYLQVLSLLQCGVVSEDRQKYHMHASYIHFQLRIANCSFVFPVHTYILIKKNPINTEYQEVIILLTKPSKAGCDSQIPSPYYSLQVFFSSYWMMFACLPKLSLAEKLQLLATGDAMFRFLGGDVKA